MTILFLESGGGGPGTTGMWGATSGTTAVDTSVFPSGTDRSTRLDTGATPTAAFLRRAGVLADAGRRISFSARFSTVTPAAASQFFSPRTSGNTEIWYLQINTDSTVKLRKVGVDIKLGTTVLSPNTWYRFSLAYVITSASNYTMKLWINGVLEWTAQGTGAGGSDPDIVVAAAEFSLTAHTGQGTNQSNYFANVYIDDLTTLDDPGAGSSPDGLWVTPKRPNANGANQGFDTTTSTTNSGYGTGNSIYVNEIPVTTTGARRHNANSAARDDYAIENAATGAADLTGNTILGICGWAHGQGPAATQTNDQIVLDNTSAVPSTICGSFTTTAAIRWRCLTQATYPGANAIGWNRAINSTTDAIMNECGVLVASLPQPAAAAVRTLALLGVGT